MRLANVSHADVQAWVTTLSRTRSPSTVRKVHRVLSLILNLGVRDGRFGRNVAEKINLPRPVHSEIRHLTHTQVEALADKCGYPSTYSKHRPLGERQTETYRLVVLFVAYTGVRFGKMAALRVGRLDLARRRAVIAESVTVVAGQGLVWGTPKTHQRREVPIPKFLAVELSAHVADKAPDDRLHRCASRRSVFTPPSSGVASSMLRRKAIGVPGLHLHELRHTAASLAIASGADVKVVQQMLGHSSATMTMDTYGHLFETRLDEVAEALDAARILARIPRPTSEHTAATAGRMRSFRCPVLPQCCPGARSSTWTGTVQRVKPQVRGRTRVVPPVGFEPTLPPPEGGALSPELRGPVVVALMRCRPYRPQHLGVKPVQGRVRCADSLGR